MPNSSQSKSVFTSLQVISWLRLTARLVAFAHSLDRSPGNRKENERFRSFVPTAQPRGVQHDGPHVFK